MLAVEQTTRALNNTISRNEGVINQMIGDMGTFTHTLGTMAQKNGEIQTIAGNLAQLTEKLNVMAGKVSGMMGEEPTGEEAGSLRSTIDNMNRTLANLSEVTRKINEGQGTVGRVVNDSELIDKVQDTLDSTNTLLGGLAKIQTQIELRSEYAVPFERSADIEPGVKNALGVRIIPKPDKYYLIEAVSDPRGVQTRTTTTRKSGTSSTVDDSSPLVEEKVTTEYESLKFSAQFAKRYYWLTLRFGIIENTGGLGANLNAWKDHLELRFDAFDFTRRNPRNPEDTVFPRFRTTAMYEFFDHLHVQGGFDDPFNPDLRTWFLGGVLRFTDEDLKSLLTVAPSP
jgi:phospholipid/cholesterol/gamma-HCH transport system substrate-binding protein